MGGSNPHCSDPEMTLVAKDLNRTFHRETIYSSIYDLCFSHTFTTRYSSTLWMPTASSVGTPPA